MVIPTAYLEPFTPNYGHTETEVFRNEFPKVKEYDQLDNITVLTVVPPQESFLRNFFRKEEVVLGYFANNQYWIQAPNQDGKVFRIYLPLLLLRFYLAPLGKIWNRIVPRGDHVFSVVDYCGRENPLRDSKNRKFLLVKAGEGFVPVRHGTDPDPRLKNWISTASQVRIVYDSARIRHPAVEGLDYSIHGFHRYGKSWWPILNGHFSPTYKRITSPYYEDYDRELYRENRFNIAAIAGVALGVGIHALAVYANGTAIAAAALRSLANNEPFTPFNPYGYAADNLPYMLQGAYAGIQPANALAQQQMYQNDRDHAIQKSKFDMQFETLELLKYQDSLDLGKDIINALSLRNQHEVERLLRENPNCLIVEHRGSTVIQASSHKNQAALRLLLDDGLISDEDRGGALIISADRQDLASLQILTAQNARIPSEYLGLAIIMSAKNGIPQILLELLKRAPAPEDRGKAVIEAVQRGALEIVNILLQGNPDISEEIRSQAAVIAAKKNNERILLRLLESGPISEEKRGESITEVTKLGKLESVRALLAHGPISLEHGGQAAIQAADRERFDILKELQNSGLIDRMNERQIEKMMLEQHAHRQQMEPPENYDKKEGVAIWQKFNILRPFISLLKNNIQPIFYQFIKGFTSNIRGENPS